MAEIEADVITTIYEARDSLHQQVSRQVVDRERQTTTAINNEQVKREQTASQVAQNISRTTQAAQSSAAQYFQNTQGYIPTIGRQAEEAKEAINEVERAASKIRSTQLNYVGPGPSFEETEARQKVSAGLEAELSPNLKTLGTSHKYNQDILLESEQSLKKAEEESARLAAKVEADFAKADKSIAAASAEASSFSGQISSMGVALGPLALVLGTAALGIAAVGVAAYETTKETAAYGDKLYEMRVKTGLSVETLGALDVALRENGSSVDRVQMGLVIFNRTLDAVRHGTGRNKEEFKLLNVDLRDNEQVLFAVLNRLNSLPEGSARSAEAMRFFGRSGAEMLKVVEQSKGSFADFRHELEASGMIMSGAAVEESHAYELAIRRLGVEWAAAKREMGSEALVPMTIVMEDLTKKTDTQTKSADGLTKKTVEQGSTFKTLGGIIGADVVAFKAWQDMFKGMDFGAAFEYEANRVVQAELKMEAAAKRGHELEHSITPETTIDEDMGNRENWLSEYSARAERKAREIRSTTERLKRIGDISPTAAAGQEIGADQTALNIKQSLIEQQVSEAQKKLSEIQEKRRFATVDQADKLAEEEVAANKKIMDLQKGALDAQSQFQQEKRDKLERAQEEEKQLRREAINATAQLLLRDSQSVYQAAIHAEDQTYNRSLENLEQYIENKKRLEGERFKTEMSALQKEEEAAKLITKPQERDRALADVHERQREAVRKNEQTVNDLTIEGHDKRNQIDIENFESAIKIWESGYNNLLTLEKQKQQEGLKNLEDVERMRYDIQKTSLENQLRLANQRTANLLGISLEPNVDPYKVADQLLKTIPVSGVDKDKLQRLKNDIQQVFSDIRAAELEHNEKSHDARLQDIEDAQRYAQSLETIEDKIKNIEFERAKSNIEFQRNFPAGDDTARAAGEALDKAMENARFVKEQNRIADELSKNSVEQNAERRLETERNLNRELDALQREHQQNNLNIERKYNEEKRKDQIKLANDIASILTAGMNQFDGHFRSIFKGMADAAIQDVRQIAAELLKSGLEAALDPNHQTRGSSSGGIVGGITNKILGALGILDTGQSSTDLKSATDVNSEETRANTLALKQLSADMSMSAEGEGSTSGGGILSNILHAALGAISGGVTGGLDKGGAMPGTGGKVVPGHATGGNDVTGWREVGEKGPELEFTGSISQIFSNEDTKKIFGSKGDTYNINLPKTQSRSYVQRRSMREGAEMVASAIGTRKK